MRRRAFLAGLGAMVAAPAVIRTPGLLMPVRRIVVPVRRVLGSSLIDARFFGDKRVLTFSDHLGDDANGFGIYERREVTILEADAPSPHCWPCDIGAAS